MSLGGDPRVLPRPPALRRMGAALSGRTVRRIMSRLNHPLSAGALAVACAFAFGALPVHAGDDGGDRDDGERDSRRIKKVFVIAMENHNWTQPNTVTNPQQIFLNP